MIEPVKVKNILLGQGRPKICVPIVGKTKDELIKAAEEVLTLPADMAEWRADWFEHFGQEKELREGLFLLRRILGKDMPILFTIRTKSEGGQAEISLSDYQKWNCLALSLEADLADIEFSAAEKEIGIMDSVFQEARRRGKKIVLSSHDFCRTPDEDEMIARLCQMQKYSADITKLAVMPQHPKDVLTLLSVSLAMKEEYGDRPFILMSMASDGLGSRLLGEIFGSCVTFGCASRSSAPGQMEAGDLFQVLEAVHKSLTA